VVVYFDGQDYWLADGFHRVQAAMQIGRKRLDADIRPGAQRDAVLHSVGANAEHGLRRTRQDKHRAVLILLRDKEWSHWSDRKIAKACSVNPHLVAQLRQSICENAQMRKRRTVERNGTTYTMDTSEIGKEASPMPSTPARLEEEQAPVPSASGDLPTCPKIRDTLPECSEQHALDDIAKAAAEVLGQIDIDLSGRRTLDVSVQAPNGQRDGAVRLQWRGRVYLSLLFDERPAAWLEQLLADHGSGAVHEAIAVVPARTDSDWFQHLLEYSVCFIRGRLTPNCAEHNSEAYWPAAVVYVGDRVDRFVSRFGAFGAVVSCYDGMTWKLWASPAGLW
jgi:hypothetical protein